MGTVEWYIATDVHGRNVGTVPPFARVRRTGQRLVSLSRGGFTVRRTPHLLSYRSHRKER
jgi:hypothetical protein